MMEETTQEGLRVVEVEDERGPLAESTLALITHSIWDVQPTRDLLSEIEERRRALPSGGDYHLLALMEDGREEPVAAAAGVYLEASNAGFITYLAVHEEHRSRQLGRTLRAHLVERFRADAQRAHGTDLAWTVGEVKRESRWLRTLVERGRAIPFDLGYFHPWMPRRSEGDYVLYREPVADPRPELPAAEVVRLVYAIWRRAYRIRFPLQSDTFCHMVKGIERRERVGPDPSFGAEGE